MCPTFPPYCCFSLFSFCLFSMCVLYSFVHGIEATLHLIVMLGHLFPFFFFYCTTWRVGALIPHQGSNLCLLPLKAQSSNHWTTRQVLGHIFFLIFISFVKIVLAGHNRKIPLTSQWFNATKMYPSSQLRKSQVTIHHLGLCHSGQAFRVVSLEKETKWRRRAHWFSAGQKWYKMDTLTVRWTGLVSWMKVQDTDCDERGLCPISLSITAYLPHPHAHTASLTFSDSPQ